MQACDAYGSLRVRCGRDRNGEGTVADGVGRDLDGLREPRRTTRAG